MRQWPLELPSDNTNTQPYLSLICADILKISSYSAIWADILKVSSYSAIWAAILKISSYSAIWADIQPHEQLDRHYIDCCLGSSQLFHGVGLISFLPQYQSHHHQLGSCLSYYSDLNRQKMVWLLAPMPISCIVRKLKRVIQIVRQPRNTIFR